MIENKYGNSPSKLGQSSSAGTLLEDCGIEVAGSPGNAIDDKSRFSRHDALGDGIDRVEEHQFADSGNG